MEHSYFDVSDLRNLMDYFIGDDMKSPGFLINPNIFLEPHFLYLGISYVFRSFFRAAGKRILFKINRYPGEFL